MKHSITTPKSLVIGTLVAALTVAVAGGLAASASDHEAVDPPSPAAGHAEVVATWLVDFQDGAYEWNVAQHTVDTTGIDLSHLAPTFLIGYGEYSTVISGPEVRGRLADGEALFRRPTLTTHAAAVGADPAALMEWTVSTEDTGPGSDPFEPGAGTHDIDILRDKLAPGETFTMRAGIPAFVMVTSGWVTTADGTRIDAGGWATLQGDIELTNGGTEPAVLLAAWISPLLELPAPLTTTSTSTTSSTTAPPTTAPPAPGSTTTAPATSAPASTSTTTIWPVTTSTTVAPVESTEPPVETTEAPVGSTPVDSTP